MRKKSLLLCLFTIALLGSCSEDPINNTIAPENPPHHSESSELSIAGGYMEFDCNSNQYTFAINTNCDYDIIIPVDWITRVNTKATHSDSITLVIAANNTYNKRQCDIIIKSQDSKASDTLHISQEEGFESIRKLIRKDDNCSIFYEALKLTGLVDSIIAYVDYSYPSVQYDSTYAYLLETGDKKHTYKTSVETDCAVWPDKREFKFTLFIEPDAVYNSNGITTINELRQKAEIWYPEHPELFDDLTNRNNSLNKFVAYHILPCYLTYDQLNISSPDIIKNIKPVSDYDESCGWSSSSYIHDTEDFYETLLPHSIMRISTPGESSFYPVRGSIYINRKGAEYQLSQSDLNKQQRYGYTINPPKLDFRGIKIAEYGEYLQYVHYGVNGIYHYIDDLLLYDEITRTHALNCRMRIMGSTFSPDYINSGARGRMRDGYSISYGFLSGYCKNVLWSEGTECYVRYLYPSFPYFMADAMVIRGEYDIAFKLPPVPSDGIYELRFLNNAISGLGQYADRGIVQFYFCKRETDDADNNWISWNWDACGDAVDFRLAGDDPSIGMIMDDDEDYDSLTDRDKNEAIAANDSLMRLNGYMKAPDSYGNNTGNCLRQDKNCYRKIICNEYLQADKDYYIRIKKVDNIPNTVCMFNFLEIVPESVYSGINGREDRH